MMGNVDISPSLVAQVSVTKSTKTQEENEDKCMRVLIRISCRILETEIRWVKVGIIVSYHDSDGDVMWIWYFIE